MIQQPRDQRTHLMSYTMLCNVQYQCAAFPCIRSDDATMPEYSVHWISLLVPEAPLNPDSRSRLGKLGSPKGIPKAHLQVLQSQAYLYIHLRAFTNACNPDPI
jgi:hypothetical protein